MSSALSSETTEYSITDDNNLSPKTAAPWPALVSNAHRGKMGKKIARTLMRTIEEWQLIVPQDRIMVAISGGKDSYTLVDMLWEAKRKAPFHFDIIAVHLDQAQPGYNGQPLQEWLDHSKMPYEIIREDTYNIVVNQSKPGQTFCFLCSRLRRGILYAAAERLGCNKIALGHHRDDALETLMMNLFYAGKLQAMPARYKTDDGKFDVIRPLIDCAESDIAAFATERTYPILPCNLCGSQDGLKRDAMQTLLGQLESTIPNVRSVMLNAIKNVRPTHLLDKDLADAWAARPAHIEPKAVVDVGERLLRGDVVAQSHTTLGAESTQNNFKKVSPKLVGNLLPILDDPV